MRYAGAKGQLTVRADSGFYSHGVVQVCRKTDVRFSITVRLSQSLRDVIEAIPEPDWRPIPYWMEGAADVAETEYTPFQSQPGAAPVRLIVRRVKPTPGTQLALFANYSYHAFITDRSGGYPGTGGRPPPPRRDRERHPGPEVRRGAQSSPLGALSRQWSLAGGAGHGPQSGPLDPAHHSGRDGGNHQDPQATLPFPGGKDHPQGPPAHPAPATALALENPVTLRPGAVASPATAFLTAPSASDPPPDYPTVCPSRDRLGSAWPPPAICAENLS